jgi:flagellar biosynthesis protein FliQ
MAAFAECAQWRSDILKGRAEQLKRKIELFDGLGWTISPADLSDALAKISSRRRNLILKAVKENYFASQTSVGPKRAVENLQESAWWSKDLAGTTLILCAIVTVVLVVGSLISLGVAVSAVKDTATLENTSRVIAAIVSLIVSLGLIRLMSGYFAFGRRSEQVEKATVHLLGGTVSEVEAIKLLHDYQIARSAAPLIPDWIWKLRRKTLNELWDQYRRGE